MKRIRLTKIITGSLVIASAIALSPIGASAEWKQDSTGKWYSIGNSWATGWYPIDGSFYYFNSSGYMVNNASIDGMELGSDGKCKIPTNQATSNINGTAISPYEVEYGTKYDGTTSAKYTMSGIDYTEGFTLQSGGWALFNLAGQYDNIKVRIGHVDNAWSGKVAITIYLDGKQSQQIELSSDDVSKVITIPVNKAQQMKIESKEEINAVHGAFTFAGFSNMIGY
ncbi:hypothetical protein B0H39_004897 [Clostridium beijerinckii]|uniref:NPCBM/NEW2 domain-containing protein n=1 Tax=Clostridium beijerinckii TaxID=1520 RepID=UPI001494DC54|nr:NPCBM/NEW2 domain-containing protein [Clostridium beijerinckii]NOW87016.1 hypothetical protein [Clostridium beijerinckii]